MAFHPFAPFRTLLQTNSKNRMDEGSQSNWKTFVTPSHTEKCSVAEKHAKRFLPFACMHQIPRETCREITLGRKLRKDCRRICTGAVVTRGFHIGGGVGSETRRSSGNRRKASSSDFNVHTSAPRVRSISAINSFRGLLRIALQPSRL